MLKNDVWMLFYLVMATFPVSSIANVTETNFRNANQSAWITIWTIFTRFIKATMRMASISWCTWTTCTIWITTQIGTHFIYFFIFDSVFSSFEIQRSFTIRICWTRKKSINQIRFLFRFLSKEKEKKTGRFIHLLCLASFSNE